MNSRHKTRPAYSGTPKRNHKSGFQRRKPGPKHANNLRAVECAKVDSLRTSSPRDAQMLLNKRMKRVEKQLNARMEKHNAYAARFPTNKYDAEWLIEQNNCAEKVDPNSWLLDSGASVTYVNDKKWLHNLTPVHPPIPISSAISGEAELCHEFGYLPNGIEAYYMPGFTDNLLSAQAISEVFGPLTINGTSAIANAHDPEHAFVVATFSNHAYRIDPWEYFGLPRTHDLDDTNDTQDDDDIIFRAASGTIKDLDAAQQLFYQTGAPGKSTLAALHKHMDGLEKSDTETLRQLYKHFDVQECVARSRAVASSFKRTKLDKRSFKFLKKLCLDTAHETQNPSINGHRYWEVVKDYHTGFTWTIPLTQIKDLAHELPRFFTDVQNRCGMTIHVIKTDGHLCYKNDDIQTYLSRQGISHETNIPHTSQQNGRAENAICKTRNRARALLVAAKLDVTYWSFAIQEGARIGNLLPSTANPNNRSPYEMATGEQPHASQLLLFGSIAWVRTTPTDRDGKMEPVASPYIYVGQDRKGYILLDPRMTDEVTTHHATHVTFDQSRTWTQNYVHEIAYEQPISRVLPTSEHHLRPYIFALDTHTENADSDDDLVPLDTTAIRVENFHNSNPLMLEGSDDEPTTHELESPEFSTEESSPILRNTTPFQTPHKESYEQKSSLQSHAKLPATAGESPASENITPPQTPHTNSRQTETSAVPGTAVKIAYEPRHNTRLQARLKRVLAGHKTNRQGKTPLKAHAAKPKSPLKTKAIHWMQAKDRYIVGVDEASRIPLPRNLTEALAHPMWREAITKETSSIKTNETFEFVPRTHAANLPRDVRRAIGKSIPTHFVFRAKPDKNGKLLKLKARLVANGNNQEEGINYFTSYAPVASAATIKVQVAHSLINSMIQESWDYASAYLQGLLNEIIYVTLPGDSSEYGIEVPKGCRILLRKSIYGLVQAGNVWFNLLKTSLLKAGFNQCPYEQCLFTKDFPDGSQIIITTYVDDLLVTSNSREHLDATFEVLSSDLKIGNREGLSWHLGMRFRRLGNSATIDQEAYTIQTINEFNMAFSKPRSTPKKLETVLSKHDAPTDEEAFEVAQKLPYRQLIGKLMHLGRQTRADISEATADCSRFLSNWGLTHWQAGKDILRYLRQSHDTCLVYHPERTESPIEIYVDAAYAKDKDDRHSHTGIAIFYYGCLVHWVSRKQKSVTLSSCEAEYVALTDAAKDAIHFRRIIAFLDKDFDPNTPTKIFEDNQGAIALAYSNGKTQARTKHIDIRMHFIRDYIKQGIIEIDWVDTLSQKADFFTKPLSGPKHDRMRHMNMNCDAAPEFDRKTTPPTTSTHNRPDKTALTKNEADENSPPPLATRGVAEVP